MRPTSFLIFRDFDCARFLNFQSYDFQSFDFFEILKFRDFEFSGLFFRDFDFRDFKFWSYVCNPTGKPADSRSTATRFPHPKNSVDNPLCNNNWDLAYNVLFHAVVASLSSCLSTPSI